MQALEVRISGSYWDSILYNDRLYLFTLTGEVEAYRWDYLVSTLDYDDDSRPLAEQFLTRGRAWYRPEVQKALRSASLYSTAQGLVKELGSRHRTISRRNLAKAHVWTLESPAHPHTDIETYYNRLYLGSTDGLYLSALSRSGSGDHFERVFDAPTLRVAGGYRTLGLASGEDGLFAQQLTPDRYGEEEQEPYRVNDKYCTACSWAYFDLVGTSVDRGGVIAAYSDPKEYDLSREKHALIDVIPSSEVFGGAQGYVFGSMDNLVSASADGLRFQTWNPYRRRAEHGADVQKSLVGGQVEVGRNFGQAVLDASASEFGSVVEIDSALLVLGSDGNSRRLGEPINWRTFPRSQRYTNQLHVTKESHVSVYAFMHDYFVNSKDRVNATRRPTRFSN